MLLIRRANVPKFYQISQQDMRISISLNQISSDKRCHFQLEIYRRLYMIFTRHARDPARLQGLGYERNLHSFTQEGQKEMHQ